MTEETKQKIEEILADPGQYETKEIRVTRVRLTRYQVNEFKHSRCEAGSLLVLGYAPNQCFDNDVWHVCAKLTNDRLWTDLFPGELEVVDFDGTEELHARHKNY